MIVQSFDLEAQGAGRADIAAEAATGVACVGWGERRTPTALARHGDLLGFASSPQPTG